MSSFYYVYWIICLFFLLLLFFKGTYADIRKKYSVKADTIIACLLVIFVVFYFGLRGKEIGTDTKTYLYSYYEMFRFQSVSDVFQSDLAKRDPFFYAYMSVLAIFFDDRGFLFVTCVLFLLPISYVIFKLFERDKSYCLLFFFLLDISVNMGINIIRAGLGMSFALLFMYLLFEKRKILLCAICALLAIGFHQSSIIILLVFLIVRYVKASISFYYLALLTAFGLAVLKIGFIQLPYIGNLLVSNERFSTYSDDGLGVGISGMTVYIATFFSFTMLLLYYFRNYMVKGDFFYDYLSKSFILSLVVYFLFLNISYSYRFGVLAYTLLPFLIVYPFSRERLKSFNYLKLIFLMLIYFVFSMYRVLPNL